MILIEHLFSFLWSLIRQIKDMSEQQQNNKY